jgi:hypothetical protein
VVVVASVPWFGRLLAGDWVSGGQRVVEHEKPVESRLD